jgi:hypothetical protein
MESDKVTGGKDMTQDTASFSASLEAMESDSGYLGDTQFIDALLRGTIQKAMAAISAKKFDTLEQVAARTGGILLGADKRYAPMPTWNEPGGIDEFCAKWCGVDETEPLKRMTGAVLAMINECVDLALYVGANQPKAAEVNLGIDGIVQKYLFIFIGVSPPDQMAIL